MNVKNLQPIWSFSTGTLTQYAERATTVAGYGVACFVIGLIVLRYRRMAIV